MMNIFITHIRLERPGFTEKVSGKPLGKPEFTEKLLRGTEQEFIEKFFEKPERTKKLQRGTGIY